MDWLVLCMFDALSSKDVEATEYAGLQEEEEEEVTCVNKYTGHTTVNCVEPTSREHHRGT